MAVKRKETEPVQDDLFATPDQIDVGGDGPKIADVEGELVILRPTEAEEGQIETDYGTADVRAVDILVLTGDLKSDVWQRTLLFGVVLRQQADAAYRVGKPLVGVVGKGDAKPGKSAPWLIEEPTSAQLEVARRAYVAANSPF